MGGGKQRFQPVGAEQTVDSRSVGRSAGAHGHRQLSSLRTVTLRVPEDFVEGFRQLAREVRARRKAGPARTKIAWRRLNRRTEILVDLRCCGRCVIHDTGPSRAARFRWAVAVFGDYQVAAGHAGELADARSQAETALASYAALGVGRRGLWR
jgi:hypothetical protein